MKSMTCVNHKQAQQVCITPDCTAKCAYICLEGGDNCRDEHQRCSIAFLSYLMRKSNKIVAKAHDFQVEKLINFNNSASKILSSIGNFLESYHLLASVKKALDPHGLLEPRDKISINEFMGSKIKEQPELSLVKLEGDLASLQVELTTYLQIIRDQRIKSEELKSKVTKKSSIIRSKVAISPCKSGLKESNIPSVQSKIKQEAELLSPVSRNVSELRKQVPKPPFFSKITNDVQTINTFFYHKFTEVKLLYRASQNQFLVSKFHEKCNNVPNTLTIVLTEFQKVIGGFTPLPWRSGGGEWYQDPNLSTFIFNLTSGERYPLINKDKAIWCSQAFGPSFGYPDLEIADKAAFNSNSCANFPQCFNNGNYTIGTGSTQLLCGTKTGHFKVKQWEVYELIF